MIREALVTVLAGHELSQEQVNAVMEEIVSGSATPAQIGGLLIALKAKPETGTEIASFSRSMRKYSLQIRVGLPGPIVDTAGTGGDGTGTFNVSTTSAILLSAGGLRVAKHGNRAVSSKSGSADLLEALGVNIFASPEVVERCIISAGFGFLYAPVFHPAMKSVGMIRRELGTKTIFNLLGPLTNPAGATHQLLGVADERALGTVSAALRELGTKKSYVIFGMEGMDEVSVCGPTLAVKIEENSFTRLRLQPEDFGLNRIPIGQLKQGIFSGNALSVYRILSGRCRLDEPMVSLALANTGLGFELGGLAASISEGVEVARSVISSGRSVETLQKVVESSEGNKQKLEELEKHA